MARLQRGRIYQKLFFRIEYEYRFAECEYEKEGDKSPSIPLSERGRLEWRTFSAGRVFPRQNPALSAGLTNYVPSAHSISREKISISILLFDSKKARTENFSGSKAVITHNYRAYPGKIR